MNIALEKLDEKLGNQEAIADAFGITQPAVSQWFRRNLIPHNQLPKAAEITGISIEEIVMANINSKHSTTPADRGE